MRITELQKNVLDCLIRGFTTKEIVEECRCSESTVNHIRANKKLRKLYNEMCYESVHNMMPKIVQELERIISDPNTVDSTKLAAIKQILEIGRAGDDKKDDLQDYNFRVVYM